MSHSWNTAAGWLTHSAAGGGLLLLLTCLMIRRTRQPARRQRLGELGLAAALVLALLSLRPPWLILDYPVSAAVPPEQVAEAPPAEAAPPEDWVLAWPAPPDAAAPEVVRAAVVPVLLEAAPASAAPEPGGSWWLALFALALPWLVIVHALGATFLLGRWLLGHFALARLLRGATPAPAEVARLFEALTQGRRRPRLLVARRLRVPLSCGLLRPTVVLPADLCAAPDLQKLRWVFAHELTHLERRDAWSAVLFALGQAVYFFLPWFGWLRRQVRLCQEYVADAAAAGQGDPAVDYAEFLLSLTGAPAVPAAASGVSGNCSDLYRRVSMLLKEPLRVEKRCPRRWSLTAAAVLFSLAFLVAGVGLRADAAPQVVVIVPGPEGADKKVKPEQAKEVRVIVIHGDGQDAARGEVRGIKVVPPLPPLAAKPPAPPAAPKAPDGIPNVVIEKTGKGGVNVIRINPEIGNPHARGMHHADLTELHKALEKLGHLRGAGDAAKAHEAVRKALAQLPDRAIVRVNPLDEGVVVLGKKAGKGTDAALEGLRKALEALQQRPELEGARKGLKQAIEQLEKARRNPMGFQAPADAFFPRGKAGQNFPQFHFDFDGKAFGNVPQGQWIPQGKFFQGGPGKAVNPELLKQVREELRKQNYAKAEELLKKALEGSQAKVWDFNVQGQHEKFFQLNSPSTAAPRGAGLGVGIAKPGAALADQLNLPKGKGLIVISVKPGSPAAKAGLKVNDVLLELNGQPITSASADLTRALAAAKGGEEITVIVLRKGKQETVKGIRLKRASAGGRMLNEKSGEAQPGQRPGKPDQGSVMTTLFRNGDRLTARYQEGSLIITLTGTVAGGKTQIREINVQDGQQSNRYDSVERVPARYRDKVNHLIEVSGRSETRLRTN